MTTEYVANDEISFQEVTVINTNGENLGIKRLEEALEIASNEDLDLVVVNPDPENPVCKIIDLSKFRYEKRQKDKKNPKRHKTKEIRISVNIEEHDLNIKTKNIDRFLSQGSNVLVNIKFPTRQRDTISLTISEILNKIQTLLNTKHQIELGSYGSSNYSTEIIPIK